MTSHQNWKNFYHNSALVNYKTLTGPRIVHSISLATWPKNNFTNLLLFNRSDFLLEQSGTVLPGAHFPEAPHIYISGGLFAKSYPTLQCRVQNIPASSHLLHAFAPFCGVRNSSHDLAFHREKKTKKKKSTTLINHKAWMGYLARMQTVPLPGCPYLN